MSTAVRASYLCARAAFPHLQERQGSLILLTSAAGVEGSPYLPAYGMVKAAQRGLLKSLAREWGPLGIRVNGIGPVAMTPAMEVVAKTSPVFTDGLLVNRTPLRRIGEPEPDIGPRRRLPRQRPRALRHRPDADGRRRRLHGVLRGDANGRRRPDAGHRRSRPSAVAPGSTGSGAVSPEIPASGSMTSNCSPQAGTCCAARHSSYRRGDGTWVREQRETYDRGNGATILLYDAGRRTVLLTQHASASTENRTTLVNASDDDPMTPGRACDRETDGMLDRDRRRAARFRRTRGRDTSRDAGRARRVRGRAPARLRRLHESGIGHRTRALLRRARLAGGSHRRRWRAGRTTGKTSSPYELDFSARSRGDPDRSDRRRQDDHAAAMGGAGGPFRGELNHRGRRQSVTTF